MSTNTTHDPPLDYSNNGPGMLAGCLILAIISTVVVALRFWARLLARLPVGLDDYLALAALIAHHGVTISFSISIIHGGVGRDERIVASEDPNAIVILFKSLLVCEILYGLASSVVKLSVLAFFQRIFPTQTVRLGCIVLAVSCILWSVAIEIVNLVQCRPLKGFWIVSMQTDGTAQCVDTILYFLGNSIVNCCIDFATLVLPIHEVLKLRTSNTRKLGICGIFLLGGIGFASSLARTISTGIMHREGVTNFTKQFVTSGMATVVEIYAAIVGACIPSLLPIYRKIRYGDPFHSSTAGAQSNGNINHTTNKVPKISKRKHMDTMMDAGSFERLDNQDEFGGDDHYHNRSVNVSIQSNDNRNDTTDIPLQGIVIKQNISWSESRNRG